MWTASLVVAALLVTLAAASDTPSHERRVADKDHLIKQKNLIQLLIRVHQPNLDPEQIALGNNLNLGALLNNFRDPQLVKRFLAAYERGSLLPRGEVFTVLDWSHAEQTQQLFELLFLAEDYDTFYRTACWARDRLNEGQFVHALSAAVLRRPDTKDIALPPPYEVTPHLFVSSRVLQDAYRTRMRLVPGTVLILDNYSSHASSHEQQLAYFTEDVGLNSYNTFLSYEYPGWLNTSRYGLHVQHRGEFFFYGRQQLLARYHLERLSLGLAGVDTLHLDISQPVQIGYAPQLRYQNGLEAPVRPEGIVVRSSDILNIDVLNNIEARLLNVIDIGTLIADGPRRTPLKEVDAMDVIGSLVHGNADSLNKRYFKSVYLMLLSLYGSVVNPDHRLRVGPGALEHFETILRDPLYYRIVKRVVGLMQQYKDTLPSYTREELIAPGVKIESVDIDRLVTFEDDFEFDLNGAVDIANIDEASQMDIRVRQLRLNHLPFSLRVAVRSEQAARVQVRVFLGPRSHSLEQARRYMVELDRFPYEVAAGRTVIERHSRDSSAAVTDPVPTKQLLRQVEAALQGKEPFYIVPDFRQCGFPERLLLPRGSKAGLPLALVVVVSPYEGQNLTTRRSIVSCGAGINHRDADNKPLGFPFDRIIRDDGDFLTPNIYVRDVIVYHKEQAEINKAV